MGFLSGMSQPANAARPLHQRDIRRILICAAKPSNGAGKQGISSLPYPLGSNKCSHHVKAPVKKYTFLSSFSVSH